jgi:hypothetical protein
MGQFEYITVVNVGFNIVLSQKMSRLCGHSWSLVEMTNFTAAVTIAQGIMVIQH